MKEPVLEKIVDPQDHFRMIERFRDQILRAEHQGAAFGLDGDICGQDENREIVVRGNRRVEPFYDGKSIQMRHVQVEKHQIGLELEVKRERLSTVGGASDRCSPEY